MFLKPAAPVKLFAKNPDLTGISPGRNPEQDQTEQQNDRREPG
jgi:hypothetical protein